MTNYGPVETKVKAATAASAAAGLVVWGLQKFVFKGDEVPAVFQALIGLAIPAAATFAGGWLTRHTHRVVPPGV